MNRFNFRKWTFDGQKLNNPLVILWRLFMMPFYTVALMLFCIVSFMADGDFEDAKNLFKDRCPGI